MQCSRISTYDRSHLSAQELSSITADCFSSCMEITKTIVSRQQEELELYLGDVVLLRGDFHKYMVVHGR